MTFEVIEEHEEKPKTEIQWLVDLMLHHKLPGPVKDKFIARIGEVERQLALTPQKTQTQKQSMAAGPSFQQQPQQASSRMPPPDFDPNQAPVHPNLPPQAPLMRAPPVARIDKDTGRALVTTGNGTMGPRKF